MVQKYIKPDKKYASKSLIMKELGLKPKEFEKLVTISGIFPYVAKDKNKFDKAKDFFYSIKDIEKLKDSHLYSTFLKNKELEAKAENYKKQRLFARADAIYTEDYKYVELLKERYPSFPEALDNVGSAISNLGIYKTLGFDDEIQDLLDMFYTFIADRGFLEYGFISKKGIYYQANIEKQKIIWLNPFNGFELKDLVEVKKDEVRIMKWKDQKYLEEYSDDEEDGSSEGVLDSNDPSKMDIAILSHSIPILKVHLKLVIHKLQKLFENEKRKVNKIFKNTRFYLESKNIYKDMSFVVKSCGGVIVENIDFCDYAIGEKMETYSVEKTCIHPQFLFDSLNDKTMLDFSKYLCGKNLPRHKSPFTIDNIIDKDRLITLSNRKRNLVQDIIDGYNDVHYQDE